MNPPEDQLPSAVPGRESAPFRPRRNRDGTNSGHDPHSDGRDEATGLPGLRSWRHVYLFVFASFVMWVLLLLALTEFYS